MKKQKAILTAVVACALVLCLVPGCAQQTDYGVAVEETVEEDANQIEMTFFGYKADALNLGVIESMLDSYMAENPNVNIVYESAKGSVYWDAVEKRADTKSLDDVFMSDHDTVLAFSNENLLVDLSDLDTIDNFQKIARDQFTTEDGKVYFLPICISTYGLYVNYDVLEENGQKVPTNWDEFAQVCDYFASKDITPIVANNYRSLPSLMVSKGMYEVYQSDNAESAIKDFNSHPEKLAATLQSGVEMVHEMISRGWIDPDEVSRTEQTSDDLTVFAGNQRPFMVTGGWATHRLKNANGDLSYAVYPYPILDDGSVLQIDVNTCISVSAQGDHVVMAKDFVEHITQPDILWEYCDNQSSYTPLNDSRTPTNETIAPQSEYLASGQTVVGSDYRLTVPIDDATRNAATCLLEGATVEEAMDVLRGTLEGTYQLQE